MCRKRQSHGSPSHLFFFLLPLAFSVRCLGHFMSALPSFPFIPHSSFHHLSSHLLSPTFLPPFPFIPHSSPSSAISPQKPPHTPQAALAHKASSQPGPISFHILLLLRSAILLAVLCHHPMSRPPHFLRPINIASFPSRPKSFAIGVLADILKAF